jgi:hypothetical protein
MSDALKAPKTIQLEKQSEKFFEFHLKGWTNFDPMHETLNTIAIGIEEGGGFLTVVEVVRVESDVTSIADEEVRECFENVIAAKRLIRNADKLPKVLLEGLRSALQTEKKVVFAEPITLETKSPRGDESESRVKRWP